MSKNPIHYALTIFLSAFLLFQVQPLIGKYILPWFGGSPAVWTTCLLFFQVVLLVGYAYSHWVASWKHRQLQGLVHLLLLAVTLAMLSIVPGEGWRPGGSESPVWHILGLLTLTVGGPYFVLSTTGPLLQAWFSTTHPSRSPYRLYALSNLGSLLGLLTYPFVFEPLLTRQTQAASWSIAYVIFVLGSALCAWKVMRTAPLKLVGSVTRIDLDRKAYVGVLNSPTTNPGSMEVFEFRRLASDQREESDATGMTHRDSTPDLRLHDDLASQKTTSTSPRVREVGFWVGMAACGSTLLLATTNQMCQDIPVVAFLWVLPLSLYLLTFIIAFEGKQWYRRAWCMPLFAVTSLASCYVLYRGIDVAVGLRVLTYSLVLFAGCMICHGELARSKPAPRHLTLFFLTVAGGGALGGIFVALVAPILFSSYLEYHLSLAGAGALALAALYFDPLSPVYYGRRVWAWILSLLVFAVLIAALIKVATWGESNQLTASRSFYGVMRVTEWQDESGRTYREMHHGEIVHGFQFTATQWRSLPTSYYGEGTGGWLSVQLHPRRTSLKTLNIGVVGLGTGTMAALGRKGDRIRFYEINPDVVRLAKKWFTYCQNTPANVEIVLGDARVQLEGELKRGHNQDFDVLIIDAFSGNAIPLHLLTRECAKLYRRHLKEDGILALHISNQALDLVPVTLGLAQYLGWNAVLVDSEDNPDKAVWAATWVLISNNRTFLASLDAQSDQTQLSQDEVDPLLWTDDFASLLHVLN